MSNQLFQPNEQITEEVNEVFIIAHACMLETKFTLGNKKKLFFKSEEGTCAVGDATQIDIHPAHYTYKVTQNNPMQKPNDYSLSFYDPIQEFGMNTFGIFNGKGEPVVNVLSNDVLLSEVVDYMHDSFGTKNFYLHICRIPCNRNSPSPVLSPNNVRSSSPVYSFGLPSLSPTRSLSSIGSTSSSKSKSARKRTKSRSRSRSSSPDRKKKQRRTSKPRSPPSSISSLSSSIGLDNFRFTP